ncbi:hypothetical protein niasHT_017139 [Heterodera trifolii]|uniref:Uncharacterized protein n=1 Tax=Heterodera trifolii TaxID=157864 RepID=A0ABD2LEF1_9BILA
MGFPLIVGIISIFLLIQSFYLITADRQKQQYQQKQQQQNRIVLSPNRVPHWKVENNINRGPFYGQPEQVHLSYASDPSKLTGAQRRLQ